LPLLLVEKLEYVYYAPYYLQTFIFLIGTSFWFLSETMHQHLPFWTQGEEPKEKRARKGTSWRLPRLPIILLLISSTTMLGIYGLSASVRTAEAQTILTDNTWYLYNTGALDMSETTTNFSSQYFCNIHTAPSILVNSETHQRPR